MSQGRLRGRWPESQARAQAKTWKKVRPAGPQHGHGEKARHGAQVQRQGRADVKLPHLRQQGHLDAHGQQNAQAEPITGPPADPAGQPNR